VAWLRRTFRVMIPLRSVFEATTVERLAAILVALEPEPGRMQQIAAALQRLRLMPDEEKARRREARQARAGAEGPGT
jgi:hypothetical protein